MDNNMDSITTQDFHTICRLCLSKESFLFPIMGSEISAANLKIRTLLKDILQIEVSNNEALPKQICPDCLSRSYEAFTFREKCYYSQDVLKMLSEQAVTKLEEPEVDIKEPDLLTAHCEQDNGLTLELKEETCANMGEDVKRECKPSTAHTEALLEVSTDSTKPPARAKTVPRKRKPQICPICNVLVKNHLWQHMRIHTNEKPYRCTLCPKKFRLKQHLTNHTRTHTGERPFICSKCGQRFSQSTARRIHETLKHPPSHDSKNFTCEYCGEQFYSNMELNRHRRRSHLDPAGPKNETFLCSYCGKNLSSKFSLDAHLRIHTGEKPYTCTICSKTFRLASNLKAHLRIHSDERPFKCNVCGKAFRDPGLMKRHVRIHTGEKPYGCAYCEKSFAHKDNLVVHTRIHTNERPYKCPVCQKGFYDSGTMKKHRKTHVDATVGS